MSGERERERESKRENERENKREQEREREEEEYRESQREINFSIWIPGVTADAVVPEFKKKFEFSLGKNKVTS